MLNERKFSPVVIVLFTLILGTTLLACDLGSVVQISFGNPTPTSTRTPRPTFTPRVESTATPEDTATPAATETPAKTATNTRAPVVVVRTATKPPAPPPPPTFPVLLVRSYGCGQDGIYEIVGSIRRPNSIFLGGYIMGLLTTDGRLLKKSVSDSDEAKTMPFDISCQRSGVLPLNLKIDATEYRTKGPFIVRIIKSENDTTPLSPDVTVDFTSPGRTFVFYDVP